MATKNKHRRKNASNAVSRQHKRWLYVDNRTRAYTEISLVSICILIAFTSSFFGLLHFFSPKWERDTLVTASTYQYPKLFCWDQLLAYGLWKVGTEPHIFRRGDVSSRIRTLFRKPLGASNLVRICCFLSRLLFAPCMQNVWEKLLREAEAQNVW